MTDYITSKERLSFNKKASKWEGTIWNVIAIIFTYGFLMQLTNYVGGV